MSNYRRLDIDFEFPEIIESTITEMVDAINQDPLIADCYMSEMDNLLKCYKEDLGDDHEKLLRDYYVKGGVFV